MSLILLTFELNYNSIAVRLLTFPISSLKKSNCATNTFLMSTWGMNLYGIRTLCVEFHDSTPCKAYLDNKICVFVL